MRGIDARHAHLRTSREVLGMLLDSDESKAVSGEPFALEVKYSPNIEIAASLYALCAGIDVGVPEGMGWMRNARDRVVGERGEQFGRLSDLTLQWTLVMDLFGYLELTNIIDVVRFLDELGRLDPVEFCYGLLSGLVPREEIKRVSGRSELLDSWSYPPFERFQDITIARRVLADPEGVRNDLTDFLRWYWEEIFSDAWANVGVFLMGRVGVEKALHAAMGSEQYLGYCHPDLRLTDAAVVMGRGDVSYSYDLSSFSHVDVFVSAFTGGRLMFNLIDGNLSVCKGVSLSFTRSTAVSGGVLNFLRAINGDTKLKILEELYKEPKTTKELSDILGIAPSTVSVHLKMMREAELIYPQRVQNQVYNRFLYENYQAFLVYLLNYFE